MADRTVTVRLKADIGDFTRDIGVRAPAAVKRLEEAAAKANSRLRQTAIDVSRSYDRIGSKADSTSVKVSKLGAVTQAAVSKVGTSASKAGQALDGVATSTDKAEKATENLSKASRVAAKDADAHANALGRLRTAQLRLTEVKTKTDVKASDISGAEESVASAERAVKRYEKAGNDSGKGFGAGLKRWFTGDGANVFKELGANSGRGIFGALMGALKTPVIGPIVAAAIISAIATALPAVGAVAAGIIVTAFGGGLAGLGIAFAAQSEVVGKKWTATLGQIGSDMKLLSKPFEGTLLNIADFFQRTVDKFNPSLASAFQRLAPITENFVDRFLTSTERLAPAFDPMVTAFDKVAKSESDGLDSFFNSLATSLERLATSTSKGPNGLADLTSNLGDFIGTTVDTITALNDMNTAFEKMTGGVSLVDVVIKPLTGLLYATITVPFETAAKAIDLFNIAIGKSGRDVDGAGKSMSDAANDTVKLAQGLNATGDAAKHGAPKMRTLEERVAAAAKKAQDAKQRFEDFITTLFRLQNVNLTLSGAQIALQAAIDAGSKSIKENGKTLDINTEKGRNNKTALDDVARATNAQTEAMIRGGKHMGNATVAAEASRQSFIRLAIQMGKTRPEAEKLANDLLTVPKKVTTNVSNNAGGKPKTDAEKYAAVLRGTLPVVKTTVTSNAGEAPLTKAQSYAAVLQGTLRVVKTSVTNTAPAATVLADQYRYALGLTPKSKKTTISTPGADESQGKVGGLLNLLGQLPASKSVTINTYRNTLETVTHTDKGVRVVKADGGYHPDGVIPSYANGKLPSQATIAPGKGGGMVQWAEQETGGEAFIPLAPSKRDRSTKILGQVAGQFGMGLVKSFANGGFTLPGGHLVDIAFLLKQLGITFNPTTGINYNATLAAANKANRSVVPARDAAGRADRTEQAAKAQVAAIQRAITLQQRAVTAARAGKPGTKAGQAAEDRKVKQEQKELIALQDKLYGAKKRLTTATAASNKADAVYKLRQDAAKKAVDAHAASVAALIEQQKAAVDFADQISQGLTSGANIGDLFQQSLTGKGLLSDLQGEGADLKKFGSLINQLRAKKLDEALIQQIIGKGAGQGGDLAQAILDGGLGLVDSLNKAQAALEAQANLIGAGSAAVKFGTKVTGARAGGGDVMAGKTYRVNELGKEYFTAPVDGHITPAGQDPRRYIRDMAYAGSAGSQRVAREVHNHQHLTFHGVSMDEADLIASRANAIAEFTNRGY